jgi:hypothetical protein
MVAGFLSSHGLSALGIEQGILSKPPKITDGALCSPNAD